MTRLKEQAATYNDIIAAAAGQLALLKRDGHLSERFYAQMVAQLNGTLYTLAFGLPPGTIPIENADTHETRTVETSKLPNKEKPIRKPTP